MFCMLSNFNFNSDYFSTKFNLFARSCKITVSRLLSNFDNM